MNFKLKLYQIVKFFAKKSIKYFTKTFTFFIPQLKGIILFHSSNPKNYNENVKYLFEYLNANSTHKCYWVTSSKELKLRLEEKNFKAVIHPSIESFYLYLRCSMSISGETTPPDGLGFINPNAIKISLSHGYGPRSTNSADGVMFKTNLDVVKAINQFDLMGFSSDYTQMLIGRGLLLLPNYKTFKTGMPRCDQLLDKAKVLNLKVERPLSKVFFSDINAESRLFLYSPTWRVKGRLNFPLIYENEDELFKLDTVLKSNNSYLLISAHQLSPFHIDISKFSNIDLFRETADYDVNQLLAEVDVLISDYSSIITEFSLLNRKMIFYIPDYDYYFDYGLNEDFRNNLPGIEIQDIKGFFKIIKEKDFVLSDLVKQNYINYQSKYYDINITNSSGIYLELINNMFNKK